ncbi:MAG: hypothetical protein U9Q79_03650, partial [Candidatus Hydrogenedentes bacterium]|nr:hypothetical protein [Candidatus Hydrogenedentota bacterium]
RSLAETLATSAAASVTRSLAETLATSAAATITKALSVTRTLSNIVADAVVISIDEGRAFFLLYFFRSCRHVRRESNCHSERQS